MNARPNVRQRVSLFLAPIIGVLGLYAFLFYMPLGRSWKERIAKERTLQELVLRRGSEHSANIRKLAAAEAGLRSLASELEATKRLGDHLVTRRADRRQQVFCTASPAALLAETLELLGRHGLVCVDSSVVARALKSQSDSLEALQPVANLLGAAASETNARCEVRITLSGRFHDLQSAVREVQRELSGAFIVSLELQPSDSSDAQAGRQIWILTLSV